jgi:hypothetical protein
MKILANFVNAHLSRKVAIILLVTGALAWLLIHCSAVYCLTPVHIDCFQNAGAFAGGSANDIGWKMMGDWRGYDRSWGFHWYGPVYLRALVAQSLPFHPLTEVTLAALAWLCACLLLWSVNRLFQLPTLLILLAIFGAACNSTVMIANGFYRPEAYVALFAVLLLPELWNGKKRLRSIFTAGILFLLPQMHPTGFIIGAAYLGSIFVYNLVEHKRGLVILGRWQEFYRCLFFYCSGIACFFSYYFFQPDAWQQLRENISAQRQLPLEWYNIFYRGFRGMRGMLEGGFLTLAAFNALLWVFIFVRQIFVSSVSNLPAGIIYAALVISAFWLYAIGAKVLNPCHLLPIVPLSALLLAWQVSIVSERFWKIAVYGLFTFLMLSQSVFLTWRFATAAQGGFKAFRDQHRAFVLSLPADRQLFLPVSLWEAAYIERGYTNCYLATFPNLANRAWRNEYEEFSFSKVKAGDLLVLDCDDQENGVFCQVANIRMRVVNPDFLDPKLWDLLSERKLQMGNSNVLWRKYQVFQRNQTLTRH